MTFTNESQMPRTWGTIIFCNVVGSLLFPAPFLFFAIGSAKAGDVGWAIIFGLLAFTVLRREDCRYWRMELYLRLRQRESIRLTKHIHVVFQLLEDGQLYAGQDVTQGHEYRVTFYEGAAYVIDPTGFFLFDPKNWPIALWAERFEEFDLWNPRPATPGQLKALIHRFKTYR